MNSFVSHNDSLPGEIIILKLVWPQNQSLFNWIYFGLLILLASLGNSGRAFSLPCVCVCVCVCVSVCVCEREREREREIPKACLFHGFQQNDLCVGLSISPCPMLVILTSNHSLPSSLLFP